MTRTAVQAAAALGVAALCVFQGMAAADELEQDWIAQDGPMPANMTHEAWREQKLARRAERLKRVRAVSDRWVYCRHYVMGGSHYAHTEALSDAQNERTYLAIGSSLCLAEATPDGLWRETVLLSSEQGCFRDVDVSPDGKRLLYAFKASDRGDDFHLYEMDLATRAVRQLTEGKGVADYEGCYLPDGRILFNSTRCIQIVDCWFTEVSNLYRCDADGKNITRITYDQVHDNFPTLTWDGRVLYTRWEYSDRTQMFSQPLFGMNVDGTNQRAVYGSNSWFPTTIIHARAVPDSPYLFAIGTGHHTLQPGALLRIDLRQGREEGAGCWQLAPLQRAKIIQIDRYGQDGPMAAYPYPVDENGVVLSYLPQGWGGHRDHRAPFALYWTDVNGARELLVSQRGKVPCGRPVPVCARTMPPRSSVRPDESDPYGHFAIYDVYRGEAMKGVPRGTVKALRVCALDYRPAAVGSSINQGLGGLGCSSTPPALGEGTWDVKRVLGEVPVAPDGSATFRVPVRTPLYFMLLDEKGRMVQTMRSWTMLQPGEHLSCIGCHETQTEAPPPARGAPVGGRQPAKVERAKRGFSFLREVQPILDRRCVSCHDAAKNPKIPDFTAKRVLDPRAKRWWTQSYISLTHAEWENAPYKGSWGRDLYVGTDDHPVLNWVDSASGPELQPPLSRGSRTSQIFTERLDKGHGRGITDAELRTLACWIDLAVPFCGDYTEGAAWHAKDVARWNWCVDKRGVYTTPGEPETGLARMPGPTIEPGLTPDEGALLPARK